ncbi:MAG: hypothetical protein Fur0020_01120 [Thermodesulfovibrionia bacterium]
MKTIDWRNAYINIRDEIINSVVGDINLLNLLLMMLPTPELISIVVRTTDSEYAGFSRMSMDLWIRVTSTNMKPIPSIAKYKRIGKRPDPLTPSACVLKNTGNNIIITLNIRRIINIRGII